MKTSLLDLCLVSIVAFGGSCEPALAEPNASKPSFLDQLRQSQSDIASARPITRGPKFHWFGYYDKLEFDPTERYVLGMEVDFEHRSPTPDDVIKIGMIDLADGDRWIELGESRAWCWQQGCMLQWRPRSDSQILWNDRQGDRLVCHVLDVKTGDKRTLPFAIYHVSPDGKRGLGLDFIRLDEMDRGYGYRGHPDPNRSLLAPENSTIYVVDLETGQMQDLISVADVAKIPYRGSASGDKHYFNHIQWSPDGQRFLFLNRWNRPGKLWAAGTRMFTLSPVGTDIRLVHVESSHFEWRDPKQILVWSRGAYRLFPDDDSAGSGQVVWRGLNGHQSHLPGKDWLVSDTYPVGPHREQHVYLHQVSTGRNVLLGAFHVPADYRGEWRCDTHPRISRSGTKVVFDSPHAGDGRQMYLVDVGPIVGRSAELQIDSVAGDGTPAKLGQPFGVEIGPAAGLYICEVENHRVRRLDPQTHRLTTVAGTGRPGYRGDGGPARQADLNEPYEIRFDTDGNLFFVEMKNHIVRRVDAKTQIITTVAGCGRKGFHGDGGPAAEAQLSSPHSIALDGKGGLLIADIGNHRIRRVDLAAGTISTIAGNGERILPRDGQLAQGNPILGPRALFVTGDMLWIALREGHSIWTMNLNSGRLSHVAGTGERGYTGDGGSARQAKFNGPKGIAVDPEGHVYVVDTENQVIRKIDTKRGLITTIAGRGPGSRGYGGDGGPSTASWLDRPHGICVHRDGTVYVGDTNNHRVRRVSRLAK